MQRIHSLGYMGFTTPHVDAWKPFAEDLYGLETYDTPDGGLRLRWDDRLYRMQFHPGEEDRLAYVGWEMRDEAALTDMIERVRAAGFEVEYATREEASARGVLKYARMVDPFGMPVEFFVGQTYLDRTFRGQRANSRFITGAQGAGHIVLVVPSLDEAHRFYCDLLGFRLSDVVVNEYVTMSFLRTNPRHHNLGLIEMPGMTGVHHFMIETTTIDEVGRAYDIAQKSDYRMSSTLGRHTGDEQLSFYMRSPSGFDIEIGADSLVVDEETWTVRFYDASNGAENEIWGHHYFDLGPQSSIYPIATPSGDPR